MIGIASGWIGFLVIALPVIGLLLTPVLLSCVLQAYSPIRRGLIICASGIATLYLALLALEMRPRIGVIDGLRDAISHNFGPYLSLGTTALVLLVALGLTCGLAGLGTFFGSRVRRLKEKRDAERLARLSQECDPETPLRSGMAGRVRSAMALLLFAFSAWVGYAWYGVLLPRWRIHDPRWAASVSRAEYWRQQEMRIRRDGWFHDDGFIMQYYGDEASMRWLVSRLRPGAIIDGCMKDGPVHADNALRGMSNQDVGHEADAWLAWWDRNDRKSQVDWVRDGFREAGVHVEHPPRDQHIRELLFILGEKDEADRYARPFYLRYNAFRWLRDSGFEPVAYALSIGNTEPALAEGLLQCARFERAFPLDDAGILNLNGEAVVPGNGAHEWDPLPMRFLVAAHAAILVPGLIGVVLLQYPKWKRLNVQAAPARYACRRTSCFDHAQSSSALVKASGAGGGNESDKK